MKFNKKMYKQALQKINSNKDQEDSAEYINQKYKDDVLHGRVINEYDGWDGTNIRYDKEMIKKEHTRKLLRVVCFEIFFFLLLLAVWKITYDYWDLKVNGTCITAYYKDSYYCSHMDEKTHQQAYDGYVIMIKERNDGKETKVYNRFTITQGINLCYVYDSEEKRRFGEKPKDYVIEMAEKDIQPLEAYIYVDPNIAAQYECNKNQSVDLYYFKNRGETILDLKFANKLSNIVVMNFFVIILNLIGIRGGIKVVLEQRRLA